jgi:gp16 family phage-associated protein
MKQSRCKTPEQVKAEFSERGESISEWCRRNNVTPSAAYRVLTPGVIALRGECHRAAVLLGLKSGTVR